jgi:hypothetical protein
MHKNLLPIFPLMKKNFTEFGQFCAQPTVFLKLVAERVAQRESSSPTLSYDGQ